MIVGCAPPWFGEEDNYPVVVVQFTSGNNSDLEAIADLGITQLQHLESGRNLPIGNAFEQKNMNFDSRVDERYSLLLPIDKAKGQSTFVIGNDSQKDTLAFTYNTEQGSTLHNGWDVDIKWLTSFSSTYTNYFWCSDDCPYHPQIIDYLIIRL